MTQSQLLFRLGIFAKREFLPERLCDRFSIALAPGSGHAAEVYAGTMGVVDESIRRTRQNDVPAELRVEFQSRLAALIPALASHFSRPLTSSEGASFLVYEPGGFYKPHRDRAKRDVADGGNETYRRRVSVVVFLNRQANPPAEREYAGGDLTLYGLIDDPAWRDVGFPIAPAPGMLVAFDANALHEVTPVTAGLRMTAVDWLF